jgi:hypothetical protein
MNPEIEKLIDFALADGVISDKEREIIRNKAEKLGEDPDEAEMILDAKLAMEGNQATTPPPTASNPPPINTPTAASGPPPINVPPASSTSNKVGNIQTCPACGATVNAMELNCSECRHEFTDINDGLSISKLMKQIEKVNIDQYEDEDDYYKKVASLIKGSIVPNVAKDIFEFGSKAVSEIDSQTAYPEKDSLAWKSKVEDCILKLKLAEIQNPNYISLRNELEKALAIKVKRIEKTNRNNWIFIVLGVLGLIGAIVFFKWLKETG